MTKEIKMACGLVALVDDDVYESLPKRGWFVMKHRGKFYVKRQKMIGGKSKEYQMHRLIMNAGKGQMIDHINGNPLDNRKSNLRFVTNSQNMMNRQKNKKSTSRFKGVSWRSATGKWTAQIQKDGIKTMLGEFQNEVDAANAYNTAAIALHGQYARLNQIGQLA